MLGEWGIVGIISVEGWFVMKQYRSSKIFDAIKYVEDTETRSARKLIYEKLRRSKPRDKSWWKQDDDLADAAATVCARYSTLGAVTADDKKVREFVTMEWANNICETYEALKDYIRYRENPETGIPGAFRHFEMLYSEAKAYRGVKKSH
jgi:hypothetical protein